MRVNCCKNGSSVIDTVLPRQRRRADIQCAALLQNLAAGGTSHCRRGLAVTIRCQALNDGFEALHFLILGKKLRVMQLEDSCKCTTPISLFHAQCMPLLQGLCTKAEHRCLLDILYKVRLRSWKLQHHAVSMKTFQIQLN